MQVVSFLLPRVPSNFLSLNQDVTKRNYRISKLNLLYHLTPCLNCFIFFFYKDQFKCLPVHSFVFNSCNLLKTSEAEIFSTWYMIYHLLKPEGVRTLHFSTLLVVLEKVWKRSGKEGGYLQIYWRYCWLSSDLTTRWDPFPANSSHMLLNESMETQSEGQSISFGIILKQLLLQIVLYYKWKKPGKNNQLDRIPRQSSWSQMYGYPRYRASLSLLQRDPFLNLWKGVNILE